MAAPYIAYIRRPVGSTVFLASADVSSLVMRQKANPQYSFKSAPYSSLYGYTGTAHRCRRFNDTNLSENYDHTNPIFKWGELTHLTRSTEGFSAPLARWFPGYSPLSNNLSDFRCWSRTTSHLSGRDVYIHQAFAILRITRGFRRMYVASPICVLERVEGAEPSSTAWKAVIIAVIRYPHFVVFFRFLHIYYIWFLKELQIFIMEGSPRIELGWVGPQPTGFPLA